VKRAALLAALLSGCGGTVADAGAASDAATETEPIVRGTCEPHPEADACAPSERGVMFRVDLARRCRETKDLPGLCFAYKLAVDCLRSNATGEVFISGSTGALSSGYCRCDSDVYAEVTNLPNCDAG